MPHHREAGAEQELAAAWSAREVEQRCTPARRRIRGGAQVHVRELDRHGERFLDPWPAGVRQNETNLAEVERGPVDADGSTALARHAPTRGTGLHHHRYVV